MYSIVLMAALSGGSTTPEFGWHHQPYHGCGCWSRTCAGNCYCTGCGCYGGCGVNYGCVCYNSCNCWGWYGGEFCTYCVGHTCYLGYGCHCYGAYVVIGCCCGQNPAAGPVPVLPPVVEEPADKTPVPPVIIEKKPEEPKLLPKPPEPKPPVIIEKKPAEPKPPIIEKKPTDPKPVPPAVEKKPVEQTRASGNYFFTTGQGLPQDTVSTGVVVINMPANAVLYVNDRAQPRSESTQRTFRTPTTTTPLRYELRVESPQDGHVIRRSITLSPGERTTVDMTAGQGVELTRQQ